MSSRTKAFFALLLVSILWGTAGAVAKILTKELSPFVILFYRFGIASLCILPFFLKEHKPKYAYRKLIPLSLLSAGNAIFFYLGITRTSANSAMLIGAAAPLVVLFLSHMLIHEHVSKTKLIGVITGLGGILYIIFLPILRAHQPVGGDTVGNILIAFALISWALYSVGAKHLLSNEQFSTLTTVSLNFFTVTAISFFVAIYMRQPFMTFESSTVRFALVLLYASIPMTLITFGLFQSTIKRLPVSTASLKDYLQFLFGIMFNALLLGERLSVDFIIGSAIVLAGLFVATSGRIVDRFRYKLNST